MNGMVVGSVRREWVGECLRPAFLAQACGLCCFWLWVVFVCSVLLRAAAWFSPCWVHVPEWALTWLDPISTYRCCYDGWYGGGVVFFLSASPHQAFMAYTRARAPLIPFYYMRLGSRAVGSAIFHRSVPEHRRRPSRPHTTGVPLTKRLRVPRQPVVEECTSRYQMQPGHCPPERDQQGRLHPGPHVTDSPAFASFFLPATAHGPLTLAVHARARSAPCHRPMMVGAVMRRGAHVD